jgi:hypothetical protein
MAKREEFARDALSTAERILRKNFDLVATIEDLELQKNAFLAFFDVQSSFDGDNAGGEFVSQTEAEKSGEEEGTETKGQETGFAAGFAAAIESAAELGTAEQRIERRREERRAEARDARAKAAKAAAAAAVREPSSASRASAEGEDKASRAAAAAKAALAAVDGPTLPGQPLGHVHKIDYAELGIDDAEMQRLREKFAGTNSLDTALYETARELATANSALRVSDGVYRAQQHVRAAAAAAAMAGGSR